jgi:putative ABC transport system permease protein
MSAHLRLAWRLIAHNLKYSLLSALVVGISIAAVVAIESLASSLESSIDSSKASLAGGDVRFALDRWSPLADATEVMQTAKQQGLLTEYTLGEVQSCGVQGRSGKVGAFVRVVDERYPLLGSARIVTPSDSSIAQLVERAGDAAMSEKLVDRLGLSVGDEFVVQTQDGEEIHLRLTGVVGLLSSVPVADESFNGSVLLSRHSFPGPAEVTEGYAISNRPDDLVKYLRQEFPGSQVLTADELASSEIDQTDGIRKALLAFAALVVLLSGLAISSTAELEMRRRIRDIATLRCLGLSTFQVSSVFALHLAIIGLAGGAVGVGVGAIVGKAVIVSAGGMLNVATVQFSLHPVVVVVGLLLAVVMGLAFGFESLWSIRRVPPLAVFREVSSVDVNRGVLTRAGRLLMGMAPVLLMGAAVVRSVSGLKYLLFLLALLMLLHGLAALVLVVVRRLPSRHIAAKLVRANIGSSSGRNRHVIVVTATCVLVLGVSFLLRDSLARGVTDASGTDRGVVMTVKSSDAAQARRLLESRAGGIQGFREAYGVDAELISINGSAVSPVVTESLTEDELSRSMIRNGRFAVEAMDAEARTDPPVVEGRALGPADASLPTAVLLYPIAEVMGVKVGDYVGFRLSDGLTREFQIVGLEKKRVIATYVLATSPANLPVGLPGSAYSFFVDTLDEGKTATYLRRSMPSGMVLTSKDVQSAAASYLDDLMIFIWCLSSIALVACLLIMVDSVALSSLAREREIGTLRAVGVSAGTIVRQVVLERAVVALIASVLGTGLAVFAIAAVSQLLFAVSPALSLELVIASVCLPVLVSVTIGLVVTAPLLRKAPRTVLRAAE